MVMLELLAEQMKRTLLEPELMPELSSTAVAPMRILHAMHCAKTVRPRTRIVSNHLPLCMTSDTSQFKQKPTKERPSPARVKSE